MTRIARFLPFLLLFALAAIAGPKPDAEAASASIRATLILGSNQGSGVDGQLRQYERNLKRVLPFNSFQQLGSGSANVATPGDARIGVGRGQTVDLSVSEAGDGKFRIAARWARGSETLINTTVVAAPERPTVLVGPSADGGKLILLIVAK